MLQVMWLPIGRVTRQQQAALSTQDMNRFSSLDAEITTINSQEMSVFHGHSAFGIPKYVMLCCSLPKSERSARQNSKLVKDPDKSYRLSGEWREIRKAMVHFQVFRFYNQTFVPGALWLSIGVLFFRQTCV